MRATSAFIVTDPYMVSSGLIDRLVAPLAAAGVRTTVFSETVPDPTVAVVNAGVEQFRASRAEAIIGFGGGSPMDTAKAINVLAAGDRGAIGEYKVGGSVGSL